MSTTEGISLLAHLQAPVLVGGQGLRLLASLHQAHHGPLHVVQRGALGPPAQARLVGAVFGFP